MEQVQTVPVFAGIQTTETTVAAEYLLADYEAPVFQILQSTLCPVVERHTVQGDTLSIEGAVAWRVLYLDEDGAVHRLEQRKPFRKTADLSPKGELLAVRVFAENEKSFCRAVNRRRVEAGITIALRIASWTAQTIPQFDTQALITKEQEAEFCTATKLFTKRFPVKETVQIGAGMKPFSAVLWQQGTAVVEECRVLSGQLYLKGNLQLELLTAPNSPEESPQEMRFSLPFGQILDTEEDDSQASVHASVQLLQVELLLSEESSSFEVEAELEVEAEWLQSAVLPLLCDCYSTQEVLNIATADCQNRRFLTHIDRTFTAEGTVRFDRPLSEVCRLLPGELQTLRQTDNGTLKLCGSVEVGLLGKDENGGFCCPSGRVSFEWEILNGLSADEVEWLPQSTLLHNEFRLLSDREAAVRLTVQVQGSVFQSRKLRVIASAEKTKEALPHRPALTLYYANADESVWDIAKAHHAPYRTMMEENNLTEEILPEAALLLIAP